MTNKDLILKVRLQRLLWHMGFFARIEIPLSAYSQGGSSYRRVDITDIDVLGLRLDYDLKTDFLAGDCKSSPETKLFDRVFWLRGAMDYFGARKGYLVTAKGAALPKQVATRLGIIALSEDDLTETESRVGVSSKWFGSCDPEVATKVLGYRADLKKNYKSESNYLVYRYWADPAFQQLKRLITVGKGLAEKYDGGSESYRWLLLESFIRFSLSLCVLCGSLNISQESEVADAVSTQIYGGALEKKEREDVVKSMTLFIQNYLREATLDRSLVLAPGSFQLDPDYLQDLAEIVYRLVRAPLAAKEVPRFMDFISYEYLLKSKSISSGSVNEMFQGSNVPLVAKLSKDITEFLLRTCGLKDEVVKPLLEF